MQSSQLSKEELEFWQCKNCENEGCSDDCNERDYYEIEKLETIFGTSQNPAEIKYDPLIKKVIVRTTYCELEEDYELYELKELGFVITTIKASQHRENAVIHLRRGI